MEPRALDALLSRLPKVELHLHIEGTLEPEMVFQKAARHGIPLPWDTVEGLRAAYAFHDLQSFLDLYYATSAVLRDEDDFHDLCWAWLQRAHQDGVVHAEIFVDPQTHAARGIPYAVVHRGLRRALARGERELGVTSLLIPCFLRHLSEEEAERTLDELLPLREELAGVGLDSGERDNPPSRFARVFARARAAGLRAVAHAGEEGPAAYVREALDLLAVSRIDHGVRCEEDPALVAELAARRVPLTVCPLSNLRLCVVPNLARHNLRRLLEAGLCVTINSDDPAYFGGYLTENFRATALALDLSPGEILALARNAVEASWMDEGRKAALMAEIEAARA